MSARTIRVVVESEFPPERFLEAARDFSDRRPDRWPNVSLKHLEVHSVGETSADVTEGTFAVVGANWERCDYDWSRPGSVLATVTDSNVYAFPGSSWELKAAPRDGGSTVELVWTRRFNSRLRGRVFGTLFRVAGKPIFGRDARRTVRRIERAD